VKEEMKDGITQQVRIMRIDKYFCYSDVQVARKPVGMANSQRGKSLLVLFQLT